ncbi:hypothetical protein OROHE_006422 [Orobanche hederae]
MTPLTAHQLQNRPLTSSSILLKSLFQYSKITLFLHLQTTHTTQIQIPLRFFLDNLLPSNREKLSKCVRMSFGATRVTPIHSAILRHKSSTSAHSRRRWAADSTTVTQHGHSLPSEDRSMRLHKFSLVGIRFRITRHDLLLEGNDGVPNSRRRLPPSSHAPSSVGRDKMIGFLHSILPISLISPTPPIRSILMQLPLSQHGFQLRHPSPFPVRQPSSPSQIPPPPPIHPLPHLPDHSVSIRAKVEKPRKPASERLITAPAILPEVRHQTIPNASPYIAAKPLTETPLQGSNNSPPPTHSPPPTTPIVRPQPPCLPRPMARSNNPRPQAIPFTHEPPYPFPQERQVKAFPIFET